MLNQEQIAQTRKANLDLVFDMGNKAVDDLQKLTELNGQAIRSAMEDAFDLAQKSLSVHEPQEWLALQDGIAKLMTDRMQSYRQQFFDLVSAAQAEFAQIGKAQCETYGRQIKSVLEDATRNSPTGSEATMTALDSAIAAANTLYETLRTSGEQAVEATRSNLEIAAAASKSAGRAIDPKSQAAKP
ncbi:Phasin family protein [Paraburkholderia sabiae]|uniref:phasin family protein n=1 Tax=Paraburkholderia sabiae TaxID=273251 RepID=UPI001CAEF147|nr:phasin family protein [Paraburkholderia sabiae]CAG9228671.1 Phasin family protein [Paraburkholderia sabiae]